MRIINKIEFIDIYFYVSIMEIKEVRFLCFCYFVIEFNDMKIYFFILT